MPFYALIHNASRGRPHVHPIRADELRETEDGYVFLWDGRIVHQAPRRLVAAVREFASAGELHRFIMEGRLRHDGAGLRISELGTAPAPGEKPSSTGTRQLAESVGIVVEKTGVAPKRSR